MGGRRKSSGRCSRRMTATRSYTSFGFSKTSSLSVHNQLLPMPRSAEQISRRAEKERERRAAESPASRQARLALAKAATRRRRQALESSITAKRLRASHPLRETHLIVQKLKLQSTEWRGACPLSMPGPVNESGHDADLHAKWGKHAMFHASKFIPWDFESPIIDATNEKESWLETWTAHIDIETLCKRKRAIGHIGKTTLQWQLAKVTLGPD